MMESTKKQPCSERSKGRVRLFRKCAASCDQGCQCTYNCCVSTGDGVRFSASLDQKVLFFASGFVLVVFSSVSAIALIAPTAVVSTGRCKVSGQSLFHSSRATHALVLCCLKCSSHFICCLVLSRFWSSVVRFLLQFA